MKFHGKSAEDWYKEVGPAVFRASRGPHITKSPPNVYVYPFKDRRGGFVWMIWHGFSLSGDIEKCIKRGGVTKRNLDGAIRLAIKELFAYRGRPYKHERK